MNLNAAFQIGRSGLAAGQLAMNVAGQNMSNAATPGYRRQRLSLLPMSGSPLLGLGQLGSGVIVGGITRALDTALLARLRHARGDEAGFLVDQQYLSGIQDADSSLGDQDLAARVEDFLGGFSDVAAAPGDPAARSVVVQQGIGLASQLVQLRAKYVSQRDELDKSLNDAVGQANDLLKSIESLTSQIHAAEAAGGQASALRDQRDTAIDQLSGLLDVTAVDRPDGSLDLLVGSTPIMLSGHNRGVSIVQRNSGTGLQVTEDQTPLNPGGSIGALVRQRVTGLTNAIARIDTLSHELINAVNRLHVAGHGIHGRTEAVAYQPVTNPAQPLSQETLLPAPIQAGFIKIEVGPTGSENPTVVQVYVDPAVDSLNSIAQKIAIAGGPLGLTAFVDGSNKLHVAAQQGSEFSVLEDQSGLFTAIQLGGFFTGKSATDIAVAQDLVDDPQLVTGGVDSDQAVVANAIASLKTQTISALGDTLGGFWRAGAGDLASRVSAADDAAGAATLVRQGLESKDQQVSGVSTDEEAVNLMAAQQQFQAAARYVSALQTTMDALLAMAAR